MCYLIAKKFDKKGCIAVKTRYGKSLAVFTENLQRQIGQSCSKCRFMKKCTSKG